MGMQGVDISKLVGIANYTLTHYKDKDDLNSTHTYQNSRMAKALREKRYSVQGGSSVTYHIVTDTKGSGRHIGYNETMDISILDPSVQGSAPWVTMRSPIAWDRRVALMNKGPSKILDYMKVQRFRGVAGHLNEIERRAVLAPDSSSDTTNPHGLLYWLGWLPAGTTDYTGSFNGTTAYYGDNTSTTTIGGLNRTTNAHLPNYACNHKGMNHQLFDAVTRAQAYTNWETPSELSEFEKQKAADREIIMSLEYKTQYNQVRNRISNGGRNADVNPYGDPGTACTMNGMKVTGLPTLNSNAYAPIAIIDWSSFYPIIHSDWYMMKDEARQSEKNPDLYYAWVTTWYNWCCDNPRKNVLLHKVR